MGGNHQPLARSKAVHCEVEFEGSLTQRFRSEGHEHSIRHYIRWFKNDLLSISKICLHADPKLGKC